MSTTPMFWMLIGLILGVGLVWYCALVVGAAQQVRHDAAAYASARQAARTAAPRAARRDNAIVPFPQKGPLL